jgi:hypothetical protein
MTARDKLRQHKRPLQLSALVIVGDILTGIWYAGVQHFPVTSGLAYTVGVTTTSGSSVPAGTSGTARFITLLAQVLLIPLGGAVLSLVTSRITAGHVRGQLEEHHKSIHEKIDKILGAKVKGD